MIDSKWIFFFFRNQWTTACEHSIDSLDHNWQLWSCRQRRERFIFSSVSINAPRGILWALSSHQLSAAGAQHTPAVQTVTVGFLFPYFCLFLCYDPAILQSRTHACHLCSKTEKKTKLDFWNDAISRRATAEQSVRWFSSWAAFRQRLDATTPMVAHQFVWMTFIWRLCVTQEKTGDLCSTCLGAKWCGLIQTLWWAGLC